MPIYAYKCSQCGHEKEVLQKITDAPLTDCPACGQATMAKMVTAAGFQLKGSGWYVTDFRNKDSGGKGKTDPKTADKSDSKSDGKTDSKTDGKSDSSSDAKTDSGSSAGASAGSASSHACGSGGCASCS